VTFCANPGCSSSDPPTSRCVRCHSVYYCGRACQQVDWKEHAPRCLPPASLRLAAVQQLLTDKGELGKIPALRALSLMHSPSVAAALPAGELAAATELERSLRHSIRDGDRVSLYKNPKALFRGDADPYGTWHRTFLHAIKTMPARCRPTGPFSKENPLVILWLGARDDNEGLADYRALEAGLDVPAVELYLIGPPPDADAPSGAGLTVAADEKPRQFGRMRVHHVSGLYPAVLSTRSGSGIPAPHYAVAFNAGLDLHFSSWAPALQHLALLQPPPVVLTTGYSTDDSALQDEQILAALGLQVQLPTRFSPEGFSLFMPHVCNNNITVSQGLSVPELREQMPFSQEKIEEIAATLAKRGFHIGPR